MVLTTGARSPSTTEDNQGGAAASSAAWRNSSPPSFILPLPPTEAIDPLSICNLVIAAQPSLVGPLPTIASAAAIAETARQMAILGAVPLPSGEQILTLDCSPVYCPLLKDSTLNNERVKGANNVRNYLRHFVHPVLVYQ